MEPRERLDRRLDTLEGRIVELDTGFRRYQLNQSRRMAALEGALERLLRKSAAATSQLREVAMGRELGKLISTPEKQKFSLPAAVDLRTLCTTELLEIGKRLGRPTSPAMSRGKIIQTIQGGGHGAVEHLSEERRQISKLMGYERAISAQMPCDLNCTAGCPDAMVAACHFDNHPVYLRVFPDKPEEG